MKTTLTSLLSLLLLLSGCTTTDDLLETILAEGPWGSVLEFDPASLPDGINPEDVGLEEIAEALPDLPDGVAAGFSPHIRMVPEGLVLSAPATLTLPVGSWDGGDGARDDPWNSQVTDSITQTNTKVLGEAPAVAMSNLYQTLGQATALSMQNAVTNQQQMSAINNAVTTQAIAQLYGINPDDFEGRDELHSWDDIALVLDAIQPSWDDFATDPTGHAHLVEAGIVTVDRDESSTEAAENVDVADDQEHRGLTWVETSPGVWDAQVQTRIFDTFGLVKHHLDTDGNGIHDVMEGAGDLDGDGVWNPADWDNDGDRLADEIEAGFDQDGDGDFAMNDVDRDGDGTLDGLPECEAGAACSCGFRNANVRELCAEGEDLFCEDIQFEEVSLEFEIVPNECPAPTGGATCTDVGGVDIHVYVEPVGHLLELLCSECDLATLEPSGLCEPLNR